MTFLSAFAAGCPVLSALLSQASPEASEKLTYNSRIAAVDERLVGGFAIPKTNDLPSRDSSSPAAFFQGNHDEDKEIALDSERWHLHSTRLRTRKSAREKQSVPGLVATANLSTSDDAARCKQSFTASLFQDPFRSVRNRQEAPPATLEAATFDDMSLDLQLLRGVYSYGFELPTFVQMRCIPSVLSRKDVLVQGRSGTGKTGGLVIALLQKVFTSVESLTCTDRQELTPRGIIIQPSRELVQQTLCIVDGIGSYRFLEFVDAKSPQHARAKKWRLCIALTGGCRVLEDVAKLQEGALVCIANTGRMLDMLQRSALVTAAVEIVWLDECSSLLSSPSLRQTTTVLNSMPKGTQTVLSDTLFTEALVQRCNSLMRKPICVSTPPCGEDTTWDRRCFPNPSLETCHDHDDQRAQIVQSSSACAPNTHHCYFIVPQSQRMETLMDLYEALSISQSIIFCNTRREVDRVAQTMNAAKLTCCYHHADMAMGERQLVVDAMRNGQSRLLVAGDALARGIDFPQVDIVVNAEAPQKMDDGFVESYIHRAGRCGRFGRCGVVITFVEDEQERQALQRLLEQHVGLTWEELPLDFAKYLSS